MPSIHLVRCAFVVLSLSVSANAQFTMPPGFLTKENTSANGATPYSVFLGAYANGRIQIINSDWTFKPAVTMKLIYLRRDSEYYYSNTTTHSQARSWTNVTIQVADSAWTRASATFSTNLRSAPTKIFNAATNWTDTTSKPTSGQLWGSHNMSFGLTTPYIWRRTADICLDFKFSGGKLANGGPWTAANYVMLDGFSDSVSNGPFYNILMTKACNQPGYFAGSIVSNGQFHAKPNTMTLNMFMASAVPSTPHIGAVGVLGSIAGVSIGACQKLHLLHTPVVFGFTTSANGFWGQPGVNLPYNVQFVGLPVYNQAAYAHPITKAFSLTGAMRSIIPAVPKWSGFRQLRVSVSNKNSPFGTLSSTFVPILRIN